MAEALVAAGMDEDSNRDNIQFLRDSIRPFAEAGSAVLLSDHVSKAQEGRGRFPRGAGSKLGRYDGAVYIIEQGKPYTPETPGFLRLRVAKDRTGGLGIPQGAVAFELHLAPGGERTHADFCTPPAPGTIKPMIYMEKILKHVATQGPCPKRELREIGGKSQTIDLAIDLLVDDGKIIRTQKGYTLPEGQNQ